MADFGEDEMNFKWFGPVALRAAGLPGVDQIDAREAFTRK